MSSLLNKKVHYVVDKSGSNFSKIMDRLQDAVKSRLAREKGAKHIKITVEDEKFNRTQSQNKYLWGVVYKYIIDNENGALFSEKMDSYLADKPISKAEIVHGLMKNKFLTRLEFEIYGSDTLSHNVRMTPSTKKLDTKQFTDYVEQVRMHAMSEWGVYIPDPHELKYDNVNKWWGN